VRQIIIQANLENKGKGPNCAAFTSFHMVVRSSGDACLTLSTFMIESSVLRVRAEYPLAKADPREKHNDHAPFWLLDWISGPVRGEGRREEPSEEGARWERERERLAVAVGRREQRCRSCRMADDRTIVMHLRYVLWGKCPEKFMGNRVVVVPVCLKCLLGV
jgi:hypothetical protein